MEPDRAKNGRALPQPFTLSHDVWGQLVMTDAEGLEHVGVELVRAFPLSDPRHGFAVCDSDGRELIWLDGLDALPAPLVRQIEDELAKREFVPIIHCILRISSAVEPSEWEVETDRGRTSFVLDSEDDVHELEERRALVTDAHGIRYLIPDVRQLDAHSRQLLERFL
ncbi:MAG TPA: DUF1854 domain-containing protein [Gemmataceae bacterium]|nr:DUF1854 domain-containing protein [Gemmataceae bacterium]